MVEVSKEKLEESAKELVTLIRASTRDTDRDLIEKGLAVWTYNYPKGFSSLLTRYTGVEIAKTDTLYIEQSALRSAINNFKREIGAIQGAKIFLLNDAKLLSSNGPDEYFVNFHRRLLGSEENYLLLFRLVNKALGKSDGWGEFRLNYSLEFEKAISGSRVLKKIRAKAAGVVGQLPRATKTTFIDTGLQGTLAMFLAETLETDRPGTTTDIRLFSVYPWLSAYFKGRFYTDDVSYLFSLERLTEQGQSLGSL